MSAQPSPTTNDPHLHRPRLVRSEQVHPHRGFNRWLAVTLTTVVGTMWCAYVFALIALVGLPGLMPDMVARYVQWISQTFLQLTLLSVIMVGQNVISAAQDARAEADHETLSAIHQLTASTDALQVTQLELLNKLCSRE